MTKVRTVTLSQFLTGAEIQRAVDMWNSGTRCSDYTHDVCEEIIRPNIDRINRALGQENDPMYLAYLVTYVVTSCSH
jgi:hypothetical protein